MKKVLSVLLLSFMFLLGLSLVSHVQAEDEIIDLYPYDQEACLLAEDACTNTKVGSSHWTMTYFGHRYHFVRGVIRYGHEMVDDNSDGWIEDSELSGLSWNAFATVFMNNTASQIDIKTANARTDITDVVHRKYAHFDENGVLQMFEDHISNYYIYNDGDATTPDWRLATQAEITAYEAEVAAETITSGDPSSDGLTRYTRIRIALDDTDPDGHVVEPLGWLTWTNADVDTTVETDVTKWSTIIADDPNNLYIPAGWTVVSFGTLDRGTANPMTTAYILTLPEAMLDDTVDPMFMEYDDQPAVFNGVLDLDDDATTPGVNIVVDYNGTYTLPEDVSASWVNMFDDTDDSVINATEHLDYTFEIYQDDTLLETITFTWNESTEVYDASSEQTVIDTSLFGSVYTGVFKTETPSNDVTEIEVDIVIGVMPPKFIGVEDRYIDEKTPVDLLEGITADDGYGNDLTDTVVVEKPDALNIYSPEPGEYEINLEFTHNVFIEGDSAYIDLDGSQFDFDASYNVSFTDVRSVIAVYDDVTALQGNTYSWGSAGVLIEVAGDGTIIRTINRRTWDLVDENGLNTPANASAMFETWLDDLVLEENGFVILVGASMGEAYTTAQGLEFGDPIAYSLDIVEDVDKDIITNISYTLTVDDMTAPTALVVDHNYTIDSTDFDNVNNAILANVVAFDNYDPVDDLAIYVSDNGGLLLGTPGTYTVEVTVEDMAGHSAVVEFDVEVVAAPIILTQAQVQAMIDAVDLLTEEEVQAMIDAIDLLTVAEVQAMLDDQTLTQAEIQALIDANVMTEEDVQGLIDAVDLLTDAEVQTMIDNSIDEIPETGCGSSGRIPSFGIVGILAVLGAAIVLFRRQR